MVVFDTPFYQGIPSITAIDNTWPTNYSKITISNITHTGFSVNVANIINIYAAKHYAIYWIAEVTI